ncbi:hypothetical protein ACTA71_002175 [Dictyostelium dimigraforme]
MNGGIFTWSNLQYTVPIGGEASEKLLLDDVMGWIKPGQMTALMETPLVQFGETLLNGKPLEIDFERISRYVGQMNVHNSDLTIREAFQFSAKLRQEPVPLEEILQYVEHVLEMMKMKLLGDALIGNLDTDGQSSYNVIKFIHKLADTVLFEHFNRILFLARGGKTVYFGDIGEKSKTLTSYFQRNGVHPRTDDENPAEYILKATGAGINGTANVDWSTVWKQSKEYQDNGENKVNAQPREFSNGFLIQFIEVYKHLNIDSSSDQQQRVFMGWESMILGVLLIYLVLPMFSFQKNTLNV